MKDNTFYFSHDANARKDEKILFLLAEHGYEGYGLYWALVEMMFEAPDTAISRKLLKGIAYDLRVDIKLLTNIITTCYNTKLFEADKDKIWSNSLRRRKAEWEEKKKKRSAAGIKGNAVRWGSPANANGKRSQTDRNAIAKNRKGKERKGKENKVFVAPSVDDVKEYFKTNGYSEETAVKAFNYYHTAEWRDSEGKPVLNWKQKMISNWFKEENKIKKLSPVTTINSGLPSYMKKIG